MKNIIFSCCLMGFLQFHIAHASDVPEQLALAQVNGIPAELLQTSLWDELNPGKLQLRSAAAMVVDHSGNPIYTKEVDTPRPIASITKLMSAMIILDADLPMDEPIRITKQDRDLLRLTGSRLQYGATLNRRQLVELALLASENRAANALARTFPGGKRAFIQAMNDKARALGMQNSRFTGPAGLDAGNVASPRDLMKMLRAAGEYPLIRNATTSRTTSVRPWKERGELTFGNTNRLLGNKKWEIHLGKTGFINEAGRCLVLQTEISGQPVFIVLLNSYGKLTPYGDSNRIRKWIEQGVKG
jgi:D-alanyl-D-alanine endopeptidase (penicillin-binding protein 7)